VKEAYKIWKEKSALYKNAWKTMDTEDVLSIIDAKIEKMKTTIRYPVLFEQDIYDLFNWTRILLKLHKRGGKKEVR
jgi:hypothetical protein